jgi:hypothetical protein
VVSDDGQPVVLVCQLQVQRRKFVHWFEASSDDFSTILRCQRLRGANHRHSPVTESPAAPRFKVHLNNKPITEGPALTYYFVEIPLLPSMNGRKQTTYSLVVFFTWENDAYTEYERPYCPPSCDFSGIELYMKPWRSTNTRFTFSLDRLPLLRLSSQLRHRSLARVNRLAW